MLEIGVYMQHKIKLCEHCSELLVTCCLDNFMFHSENTTEFQIRQLAHGDKKLVP